VHGETGLLVPFDAVGDGSAEPRDPQAFSWDLASAINELLGDRDRLGTMSAAARERVISEFSWRHIAGLTRAFYQELLDQPARWPAG
jgi:alpha-maltose-1-phosphate synthase